MAGFLNAASKYATRAATNFAQVVSPQKKKDDKPATTYDGASEDILHKINQDMESALHAKVGLQRGYPPPLLPYHARHTPAQANGRQHSG